jgi:hypothetical protein
MGYKKVGTWAYKRNAGESRTGIGLVGHLCGGVTGRRERCDHVVGDEEAGRARHCDSIRVEVGRVEDAVGLKGGWRSWLRRGAGDRAQDAAVR